MTIASLNARLKKCDPSLRLRKRSGFVLLKAEGFAPVGVYRRNTYLGFSTILGDIPYNTRPMIYRVERIPGMKKPLQYIHARQRRGRRTLLQLLRGHRGMRHRWQEQLLKI